MALTKKQNAMVLGELAAQSIHDSLVKAFVQSDKDMRDFYLSEIPEQTEILMKQLRKLFKNIPLV